MNLSLYIARRYLFSKKSHQVINIISGVAVAGIALATIAMICTLSVFNGFTEVVEMQFTAFDPQVKIETAEGKTFDALDKRITAVTSLPEVVTATQCLEERAMVQYNGQQVMVMLKGVEENFTELTRIEDALFGNGTFIIKDSTTNYAVIGAGVTSALNCGIYFTHPLEVYAPKRNKKANITNPASNFKKDYLYASGVVFAVQQQKYDNNYLLSSIDFARNIFNRGSSEVSSVELRLNEKCNETSTIKKIEKILGRDFTVKDRYKQQEDVFKIMQVEKFISYIFLSFILLIACFNIIGSLSMLVIEKRQDIETLRNLGAGNKLITDIFVFEGCMISALGAVSGIVLGIGICMIQQHFGVLSLGDGSFAIDSYPVKLDSNDILLVFATVLIIGAAAVGIPVRLLTKRILKESEQKR